MRMRLANDEGKYSLISGSQLEKEQSIHKEGRKRRVPSCKAEESMQMKETACNHEWIVHPQTMSKISNKWYEFWKNPTAYSGSGGFEAQTYDMGNGWIEEEDWPRQAQPKCYVVQGSLESQQAW